MGTRFPASCASAGAGAMSDGDNMCSCMHGGCVCQFCMKRDALVNTLQAEVAQLEDEARKLVIRLEGYAGHTDFCAIAWSDGEKPCTCGAMETRSLLAKQAANLRDRYLRLRACAERKRK